MAPPRFTVRPEDVQSHAGHVAAVGDVMRPVLDAAATTTPSMDAYGKLCVMVPPMLNLVQDHLVGGITAAQTALRDTAGALHEIAASFDFVDENNATGISEAADRTAS